MKRGHLGEVVRKCALFELSFFFYWNSLLAYKNRGFAGIGLLSRGRAAWVQLGVAMRSVLGRAWAVGFWCSASLRLALGSFPKGLALGLGRLAAPERPALGDVLWGPCRVPRGDTSAPSLFCW